MTEKFKSKTVQIWLLCSHFALSSLGFPPVQEALWGKPRSTEASKSTAARLLHEPLSYNTAGFLFSCLNTFYMLSARTRLNNLE